MRSCAVILIFVDASVFFAKNTHIANVNNAAAINISHGATLRIATHMKPDSISSKFFAISHSLNWLNFHAILGKPANNPPKTQNSIAANPIIMLY
jgi:hypothetical protein